MCSSLFHPIIFLVEKDSAESQDPKDVNKVDIQAQQSSSSPNSVFVQSYDSRPNGPYASADFVSDHGGTCKFEVWQLVNRPMQN